MKLVLTMFLSVVLTISTAQASNGTVGNIVPTECVLAINAISKLLKLQIEQDEDQQSYADGLMHKVSYMECRVGQQIVLDMYVKNRLVTHRVASYTISNDSYEIIDYKPFK